MLKNNLQDKVLAEKREAVAIWLQIEALSQQFCCTDADLQEAVRVSCTYGRIKYQLIEQMWRLMLEEGRCRLGQPVDMKVVSEAIDRYDDLWQEWRALKQSSRWCATLYTDMAFRNQKQGSIGELVDAWRERISKD